MSKQMKSIRVSLEVKDLMREAHKCVMVQSGGEIYTVTDALKHILIDYLEHCKKEKHV